MRLVCKTCGYTFVHPADLKKTHQGHEFMTYKQYGREYADIHGDPLVDGKEAAEEDYQEWKLTGLPVTRAERIQQKREKWTTDFMHTIQKPAEPPKQLSWFARFWLGKVGK